MVEESDTDTIRGPVQAAIRACRRFFLHAAIFSLFLNLLYLAPTIYMLQVYDRVVPTRGMLTLGGLTLIFVAAVFTIASLDLVRTRLLVAASARLDRILIGSILDALMRVAADGKPQNSTVLREFDLLRQTLTGVGVLALFDVPWTPIYVLVCFFIHPTLGALALVGGLLLGGLSWLSERATSGAIKLANHRSQLSYMAIDNTLAAASVASALGMREALVHRHLGERAAATRTSARAGMSAAVYSSYVKALRLLMQSLALGLGALLVIEQQITPGSIFAASLLVSRALAPIELITGAWKGLIQSRAAYRQLNHLFATRGPIRTPILLPAALGKIEVENLAVASPTRDRLLLQGVSFALKPGELLGIIGPSGAGKSTLVRAMVGIMQPVSGTVRIDDASLPDWPDHQLAETLGYVPQEPTLFRGTIRENIARFQTELADPQAVDAEVVRAAQLCGAHDFILHLPAAYETPIGLNGSGLSVGQAHRVALARALYGRPRVVIMDEPNASLDAEGESDLAEALAELRSNGVTLVIVAHRAAILSTADKLMLIRNGRMELFGERKAVLARLGGEAPPPETIPAGGPSTGAAAAGHAGRE
jgi:ATP-binding cassette subfamily C protein